MDEIVVKNSGYINLKKVRDDRDGNLIILEGIKDVPFEIKRVYYINNLENSVSVRGQHAHKEIEQAIFCVSGSFTLKLDDGKTKQEILMNRDNVGVLLGRMLWHAMENFSSGCILLVVASDYYREDDYIRNYSDFIRLVEKS
ncbi:MULTISPECIES: sugar 3,4-ketoisomerase [Leptospira]|uniref:WxcM-like protein n=1 Tax=Leptospira kirschneri str. 200802841 TaxID=1193047 RepID=A0A828Y0U0_9LEPT|nr:MULTISPECIES: FdtA/QdtA family cupin domain-containing protein [Leptospira]EKO53142.1 WxcM-like protein [Leptospira kirschneri str. 200802841]EKP05213.1 WxcM-like protein [Leptospira kirschneri str. 2008720114]EKQ82508.1 WxcM-like protein [Leptospira kirschneri serovar Grippotyphosa str. Moskva]EKR07537.1 WxcM-like protein [Leptospira kirschneri serovar Valbuzzi str. 200702274]EMJ93085.1 WxcM-like protein [Leptospira kirschneri str. JB]